MPLWANAGLRIVTEQFLKREHPKKMKTGV